MDATESEKIGVNRSTLVLIVTLCVGAVGVVASCVWLYLSGVQADANPGAQQSQAPWLFLIAALLVSAVSAAVLLRSAIRGSRP